MIRHLALALPLALLACGPLGGTGVDPGGTGGGLCIEFEPKAAALLEGTGTKPGLLRDGAPPKLGSGTLQAHVVTIASDHLDLGTVAGNMVFGWAGEIPAEITAGAPAQVFQRAGWDYVAAGGVTLGVFASAKADPPPSPVNDPAKNEPSWTDIQVIDGCTADAPCGELGIHQLQIDDVKVYPGFSADVGGWTVWNRGVVTSSKTCDERAATFLTAVRKPPPK